MEQVRKKHLLLLEDKNETEKSILKLKRSLISHQKFYDPCLLNNDTLAKV